MTLKTFPDIEQRSEAWFEVRRGIVTASSVGKLVTPSTLKVANNDESRGLTAMLVAERITGWTDETYISNDMWRGIDDEPRALAAYSEHYAEVKPCGFMVRTEKDWKLGASPDGLVGDRGLVEVKSRRPKKQLQTILADCVPNENYAQLQALLLVSGREWIDYISYAGGLPLWVRRVFPEAKWQAAIIAACTQYEQAAAEMVAAYEQATKDLPMTERVVELEMVI